MSHLCFLQTPELMTTEQNSLAYFEMRLILARLFYSFDLELREDCEDWISGQRHYMAWEKPPLFVRLKSASRVKNK